MSAIVPDTLQGALIVSVIDFFLSFLIISGIGVVLAMFPLLNRAALVFKRAPAARAHGGKPAPGKVSAEESKPAPQSAGDIAAIAAAVFAVMDGAPHRIINIEPSPRRSSWVAEGRIAQHGSHTPVR
jgi:hypothetical protein